MHFDWETFTYDEAWLREAVRQEEAADCDVSAGHDWGTHLGTVMANPEGFSHFAPLRSMVMQVWKQLVAEWNLGIGAETAEACGQALIMQRLRQPVPEVQQRLIALLEAKVSRPQGEWALTESVQAEIRSILSQVLTQEDWKAVATSASDRIRAQVLEHDLAVVASH